MTGAFSRRVVLAAAATAMARPARAAAPIGVGVLTDLSGPYRSLGGPVSIAAARLAAAESGQSVRVLAADHRNDPAVAARILAGWFDQDGIDIVVDVPNSAVAIAVRDIVRARNKTFLCCGAGTTALAGSPNTVHWAYTTTLLARCSGGAVVRNGGARWFLLAAGYEFGRELAADVTRTVQGAGGQIEDVLEYPFPYHEDFATLLGQAQTSPATVLGLCNGGQDAVACVRAARQTGLSDKMRLAALLLTLPEVGALGLPVAQGLVLTETFYWDLNDRSRAFTDRLMRTEKPPTYPNMVHAGCYASLHHALRAAASTGVADGAALVARMRALPTQDDAFGVASIRADGTAALPAFLFEVKSPEESSGDWDFYRQLAALPASTE